jgi:hypothetical protein
LRKCLHVPPAQVLIVGGTAMPDKGPQIAVAELWDPKNPKATTVAVPMPAAFRAAAGPNW